MIEESNLEMLVSLLPPGEALSVAEDSRIRAILRVWARMLERPEALADFIVRELDPRVTSLFLEDHERELGLPECSETLAGTSEERRLAVVEKKTRSGDLTLAGLEAAAQVLGFDVTITEHFPYAPSSDGSPLADAHIFDVLNNGELPVTYFRVGQSRTGESLGSFGDERLICLLESRKPAHLNYRLQGT